MITAGFTAAREGFSPIPGFVPGVLMTAVPHADRYVTGGCRGGDAFIGAWLHANRPAALHTVVVPANRRQVDPWWLAFPAGSVEVLEMAPGTSYKDRNQSLVRMSSIVFGFPAHPEDDPLSERSGTWQTIRMARECGNLSQWHCVSPPYQGLIERWPSELLATAL